MTSAKASGFRSRAPVQRCRTAAFTLIELLVVIAVIAILCAILLPTITNTKASAQSAACKANLKQLGVALNMYVADHGVYPQLSMAGIRNGEVVLAGGTIIVGDPDYYPTLGAFLEYIPIGSGKVILCPSKRPSTNWWWNFDYGYNAIGAAWDGNKRLALGLTPAQIWTNSPTSSMASPFGQIQAVYEPMVVNPSDMIAIGDSFGTVQGFIDPYVEKYNVFAPVGNLHNQGANVAFCDGHVEYGKQKAWIEPTAKAMIRWNRDHQPHLKE